jgi:DNA-binding HxlR family transcriptional regulator
MTAQELKSSGSLFIGRWTPKVLFSLEERPHRHGELRYRLRGISQRMLTRTLRNLESTGLVSRRVTRSKIVTVEYSLTRLGRTLIAPLRVMCRWARRYGRYVIAEVHVPESASAASPNQPPSDV